MKNVLISVKKFFTSQLMENFLRFTTIVANLGLIFTILYTYNNFEKEIYNENQNFAVRLYKDYSDLVLKEENRPYMDTSLTNHLESISEEYKYFVGFVLFYAESIYNIMNENDAWLRTIEYMLQPHLMYIYKGELLDKAYNPQFVIFCKKLIQKGKSENSSRLTSME